MSIYRKIYEQNFGPIPKEPTGRSYEIHHLDGNHSNNHPQNLQAVTIQEHYDIHKTQGDYEACILIGLRLLVSPKELSKLATQSNLKRIKNGTHNFLIGDPEKSRRVALEMVKKGIHPFLGGNKGIKNSRAKLTEKQIEEIREIGHSVPYARTARNYHVTPEMISNIVRKKNWC